jgi:hypothetical protein
LYPVACGHSCHQQCSLHDGVLAKCVCVVCCWQQQPACDQ